MAVTPIPVILLFVFVQFVVVAVGLVAPGPVAAVNDILIVIPGVPVAVIVVINAHMRGASKAHKSD